MDEKIKQTLKSAETEDWLDLHVVRPLCYYLALGFAKLDIHPNTVTILSMIIGAGSAVFFGCASYHYAGMHGLILNIVAILMLCLADIFDCTDGQLARMTGKKSRTGRILDGMAGFVWFVPIYLAMVYRFYLHHDIEFDLLGIADTHLNVLIATAVAFILGIISGFAGISSQQRLADYYIQVHLFFVKGEKDSELDSATRQQNLYDNMPKDAPWWERMFQKSYIRYTKKQEDATPEFQRLIEFLHTNYGKTEDIPQSVRDEFRRQSLPVIWWNGLLTFNFRSLWLFVFCLADVPVVYFLWEIVVMGLLCKYVNWRHEAFCKRIADGLD